MVNPGIGEAILRRVRGQHPFESCVEQLATAIRLGVYEHGSMLPPERELAERNVSSQVRHLLVGLFSWASGSAPSVGR